MAKRPDKLNSQKASTHRLAPGRFFKASVTSVDSAGRVFVKVPDLGTSYGPITPLGTTALNKLSSGDLVQCTFTDEFFTELMVIGSANNKQDVYASKAVVDALIALINSLAARVTTLENA